MIDFQVESGIWNLVIELYPCLVECITSTSPHVCRALREALHEYKDMLTPTTIEVRNGVWLVQIAWVVQCHWRRMSDAAPWLVEPSFSPIGADNAVIGVKQISATLWLVERLHTGRWLAERQLLVYVSLRNKHYFRFPQILRKLWLQLTVFYHSACHLIKMEVVMDQRLYERQTRRFRALIGGASSLVIQSSHLPHLAVIDGWISLVSDRNVEAISTSIPH